VLMFYEYILISIVVVADIPSDTALSPVSMLYISTVEVEVITGFKNLSLLPPDVIITAVLLAVYALFDIVATYLPMPAGLVHAIVCPVVF